MTPSRRRLLRSIMVPILLVGAALIAVIAVESASQRTTTPAPSGIALPPIVELDLEGCQRDHVGAATFDTPLDTAGRRVTSDLVLGCPSRFDGRRVTYLGEVVGDLLVRDGGAWVLVNDDDYALRVGPLPGHREHRGTNSGLSVWLPNPLADQLTGFGRPGIWGDVIQVTGRIHRSDTHDGGGLTLRAEQLSVRQASGRIGDPLRLPQLVLALVSALAAIVALLLRRRAVAHIGH